MLREYRDPWGGSIGRHKARPSGDAKVTEPKHPGATPWVRTLSAAGLLLASATASPARAADLDGLDCAWCELRHGVKFEYRTGAARFDFGVNTREPGAEPTRIVRFGESPDETVTPPARAWSLGVVLEAAGAPQGLDRIEPVPQLRLDGDVLFHMPGDARISIQYATWRTVLEPDRPGERALQALLHWQF